MTRDSKTPAPGGSPRRLTPSRRTFLKRSAAVGGMTMLAGAGVGEAMAAGDDNLPPNVPEWMKTLGSSVTAHPYGMPSQYEKNVIRRNVGWLTATEESSRKFTPIHELDGIIQPNGLCSHPHPRGPPETK